MAVMSLHAALFVRFGVLAFRTNIPFWFLGALSVRDLVVSIALNIASQKRYVYLYVYIYIYIDRYRYRYMYTYIYIYIEIEI